MIYPFWMTARMRRHHYRVCVRPTRQGEFLIHPFAHKRGGVGYVATKSIKDQWEAPFMHPTYIALIVGILISCLLLIVIGGKTLPILVLMIAGWRLKLKMDENKRFQALRPQMRLAPMTLSKKRYDIDSIWLQEFDWAVKDIINGFVTRLKLTWTVWTKGYVQCETVITMTEQQALNYAETLKSAVKDVKEFKEKKN